MATRNYQSIGEVLVSVKTEFPDITISKIRFLESEGLIEPERTPSGYRKFYDKDDDRLVAATFGRGLFETDALDGQGTDGAPIEPVAPEPDEELAEAPTGLQMSIEEMSAATGIDRERIRELESFGLVKEHGPDGARYFDGDDYIVLSIVKDFFRFGVEPRHLTMYKHFEEREADFFESIVMPQLRQRNPDARRGATASLVELARASRKLKQALLRTNLRQHLT